MQLIESQTNTCNVILGKLIPEKIFHVTESWESLAFYRGKGLSLEKSEKISPKRVSQSLSAPEPNKLERGPGNPLSDSFQTFLGRGLFDPCRRPTISQTEMQLFRKVIPITKLVYVIFSAWSVVT